MDVSRPLTHRPTPNLPVSSYQSTSIIITHGNISSVLTTASPDNVRWGIGDKNIEHDYRGFGMWMGVTLSCGFVPAWCLAFRECFRIIRVNYTMILSIIRLG